MKRHSCIVLVAVGCAVLGTSAATAANPPGLPPAGAGLPGAGRFPVRPVVVPQSTGGPDVFGYAWDESVPFAWIDATDGTQLSLGSCTDWSPSVAVPFPFRFYGKKVEILSVQYNGALEPLGGVAPSFYCEPERIPSGHGGAPLIAPLWSRFTEGSGAVFTKSGGKAPDRWLAVEWVERRFEGDPSSSLTFEAVLHEGGSITFQYQTMDYGGSSQRAVTGVQDTIGYAGLCYQDGSRIAAGTAVRFVAPKPAARVAIYPPVTGVFVAAGQAQQSATFLWGPRVFNDGELGADTFNLAADSTWDLSFYLSSDSDGDGIVDSGPVPQGWYCGVYPLVDAPPAVGAWNNAVITATSALDPTRSATAVVQNAVPARFALARQDAGETEKLMVARPDSLIDWTTDVDPSNYTWPAVVEEHSGDFLLVGFRHRWNGSAWVSQLDFSVVRSRTEITRLGYGTLDVHQGETMNAWGFEVAAAVTPDRHGGIIWHDDTYDSDGNENDNVYFAVVDEAGSLVFGPENVTRNEAFGRPGDEGVPFITGTHIAALGSDRFVLTWVAETDRAGGTERNVYMTIYDSGGDQVMGVTNLSDIPAGTGAAECVGTGELSDGRAAVAFPTTSGGRIQVHVLDGEGTDVAMAPLEADGRSIDIVELGERRTLIAWLAGGDAEFAILDPTFAVAVQPTPLPSPVPGSDSDALSVTTDALGNGIIVWQGFQSYRFLTYAYVDPSGRILTPPTVFFTSNLSGYFSRGSGVTTYRPFADVPRAVVHGRVRRAHLR
jgi:hypothetical protein